MKWASSDALAVAVFLLMPAVLPLSGQEEPRKKKEKPMLECRVLFYKTTKIGVPNEVAVFEVELKNISDKPIEIAYTYAPEILQFMKKEVHRPDKTKVTYKCLDSLSPFSEKPRIFTLQPGKATKAPFGSEGKEPGVYRVQAIFEYENMKAVSPVVEVELKSLKK
jgi:hypothetical protein